jgi:hypothetical protein
MRSGASSAACFDASFAVSAMRARECRWSYHSYSDAHRVTNIFHIEMQIQENDYQGNPFEICLNQSQAAT